jgi:hypothetical protein
MWNATNSAWVPITASTPFKGTAYTADHTLTIDETVVAMNSAAAHTFTLPATAFPGKTYYISNVGNGTLTINGNGNTINDGASTIAINQVDSASPTIITFTSSSTNFTGGNGGTWVVSGPNIFRSLNLYNNASVTWSRTSSNSNLFTFQLAENPNGNNFIKLYKPAVTEMGSGAIKRRFNYGRGDSCASVRNSGSCWWHSHSEQCSVKNY